MIQNIQNVFKIKKKDQTVFYIYQILRTYRFLRLAVIISSFFVFLTFIVVFMALSQPERIVLLDGFGKAYVLETTPDNTFFNSEVQFFVSEILTKIYDRVYTDFIDSTKLEQLASTLRPFFQQDAFPIFWQNYISSHYVNSLVSQKAYTRIKTVPPFDYLVRLPVIHSKLEYIKKDRSIKLVALKGKIHLLTYSTEDVSSKSSPSSRIAGESKESTKEIMIVLRKGGRTYFNPHGLYVVQVYEQ